jgi:hypothetical protein
VVLSELIELGQQAVSAVTRSIARGDPLVQCQLLASNFYEALRHELRGTPHTDVAKRSTLIAAANRCHRVASASIRPGAILVELKSAIATLQSGGPIPPPTSFRPMLRVIEGGLSRI